MTVVTPVEGLVALLRQRLMADAKGRSILKAGQPRNTEHQAGSLVQALAEIEGFDERRLRRALIQDLLTDHFGKALVNDARFQQVVDRVTATLDEDAEGARLMSRVIADLRHAARQG
jgi:hypothetical protein